MSSVVVFIAQYLFLVPLVVLGVLFIRSGKSERVHLAVVAAVAIATAFLLAKLGNHFIIDQRPFMRDGIAPLFKSSNDNGFPSDHTLVAAIASLIVLSMKRTWGLVLLALSLLIGWARVYSGVHHLADVVGSIAIAGIAVCVGVYVGARLRAHPSSSSTTQA